MTSEQTLCIVRQPLQRGGVDLALPGSALQRAFKRLMPWKSTLKRTLNGWYSESTALKRGATCCT